MSDPIRFTIVATSDYGESIEFDVIGVDKADFVELGVPEFDAHSFELTANEADLLGAALIQAASYARLEES